MADIDVTGQLHNHAAMASTTPQANSEIINCPARASVVSLGLRMGTTAIEESAKRTPKIQNGMDAICQAAIR